MSCHLDNWANDVLETPEANLSRAMDYAAVSKAIMRCCRRLISDAALSGQVSSVQN